MGTPFMSQIDLFAFSFAPKGWAKCEGQLLPINTNQALFSLLGTTYGGDGRVNFALPDLRGRVPISFGQGHTLGEVGGSENVTLGMTQLPTHTHELTSTMTAAAHCKNGAGNSPTPVANTRGIEATGFTAPYSSAPPDANMSSAAIVIGGTVTPSATGGSLAHTNQQPFLTLNYCIALQGIFPSRP